MSHMGCVNTETIFQKPFFFARLLDFILIYWVSFSDPYIRRWYRYGDTSVKFYMQGYSRFYKELGRGWGGGKVSVF